MIQLTKTDATNQDFKELVALLDARLADTDGDEHAFYDQYNKLDQINHVVVAYENKKALGCGAIKAYDDKSVEIKRMYVLPISRGKGIASKMLVELENWAKTLQYKRCVLECGKRQPDAIACYQKNKYAKIPNYGQYIGMDNSICFEKLL